MLRERNALLMEAVRDQQQALELSQVQFRVGSIDLRAVGQRRLALLSARTALLRVQSEQGAQRTNLHLALGGDFGPSQPDPLASR